MYEDGKMMPYTLDITPMLMLQQVFCAKIHDDYLAIGTVRGGLAAKNMRTGAQHVHQHADRPSEQHDTIDALR